MRAALRLGGPRARAVLAGVALGLVLLVAFTAFVLHLAENAVRREADRRVRASTQLTATIVSEQSLRFAEVAAIAARPLRTIVAPHRARLDPADARRVRATLDALPAGAAGVDGAVFTDALGRAVAAAPRGAGAAAGTDLSGQDWYRGLHARGWRGSYLSRASVAATGGVVTVEAVPVRDAAGRLLGVLAATVRGRTQALTDGAGRLPGGTVTVTDQAGVVVAQTGRRAQTLVSRDQDGLVRRALRGAGGVEVRDLSGQPTVSAYAPVPGTGWTVVGDVPASRAFSDVSRLRTTLLIGAAVVAFFLVWLVPLLVLRLGRARERLEVTDRFQADLLPSELPAGVRTHYVASERRMLLGGDFLDAVTTPDGGLAVLIGDVCGHGPRAAALAARLRAAWRVLATAGVPVQRLDLLDLLVESERHDDDMFATVAVAAVDPSGTRLRYALAGHPPIVLARGPADVVTLEQARGPALGLDVGTGWTVSEEELGPDWTLVLYTDGLIEARERRSAERLEVSGLRRLVAESLRAGGDVSPRALAERLGATTGAGPALDDDVALLTVSSASLARPAVRGSARATTPIA